MVWPSKPATCAYEVQRNQKQNQSQLPLLHAAARASRRETPTKLTRARTFKYTQATETHRRLDF
eukprot:14534630-Heterocapsa_arctica.AAC.1